MKFLSTRGMGEQIIRTSYFAESTIVFNMFLIGFRYNSITGAFTVPIDGDGYYFFSTNLIVDNGEFGYFDIEINGDLLCTAYNDLGQKSSDTGPATCSAVAYVTQGKICIRFNLCFTACVSHSLF